MEPRRNTCAGYSGSNPPIKANMTDFTSWMNGRAGVIAQDIGAVHFNDFKVSDNCQAGIEVSKTVMSTDWNHGTIDGGFMVGRSEAGGGCTGFGVIAPINDGLLVNNVTFYNYNHGGAALGTCSHCNHPASTDSGGRVMFTKNLKFDDTTTRRVNWQWPNNAIIKDLDGTLTDLTPNSWVVPGYPHFMRIPGCEANDTFTGYKCDDQSVIRKVNVYLVDPRGVDLRIANFDKEFEESLTFDERELMVNGTDDFSTVPMKIHRNPARAHTFPIASNHRYFMKWGSGLGSDYNSMTWDYSAYVGNDEYLQFYAKHVERRDRI
jgi:hypothetical protein